MSETLCTHLEWDTDFFGYRIYRVNPARLRPGDPERILAECRKGGAECIYFLADADDEQTLWLAEQADFRRVDTRVTLVSPLEKSSPATVPASVRPARASDVPALEEIAETVHTNTRFYADPRLSSRAPTLYRRWISQSVQGAADIVWVAEADGRPVGYLTCHREEKYEGRIGLVGVDTPAQGKGLGRVLVESGLRWFREHDIAQVRVVTQGSNMSAQRLYEGCGFVTEDVQIWFHRWLPTRRTEEAS